MKPYRLSSYVPNKSNQTFSPKPWWNSNCSKAVELRRLAFKKFKLSMTPENYNKYATAQLNARSEIQSAKKLGWEQLCHKIGNKSNTSFAWHVVKKLKSNPPVEDNKEIINDKELAERFMKNIAPDYVPAKDEVIYPNIKPTNRILESNFELKELLNVLRSKKIDTSPGLDNISYSMVKHLPHNALLILLDGYNNIWNNVTNIPDE